MIDINPSQSNYEKPKFTKMPTNNGQGIRWENFFPKSGVIAFLEYMVDDKGFAYILVGKMDGDTMSDEKVFSPDTQGTLEATQYFQELSDKQEFKDNPPPPPPPPPTDPHQQPPPPPPPPPQDEKQYFYRLRKDNNTTLILAVYEYDTKNKTAKYISDDGFNVNARNADGSFIGMLNNTQDESTLKRKPMFDGEGMEGYEITSNKPDDGGNGGHKDDHKKPDDHGKPQDHGKPDDHSKPQDHGKPQEHGKPQDHGKPQRHIKPQEHVNIPVAQPITPPNPQNIVEQVEDALKVTRGGLKEKFAARQTVNTMMRDLFNEAEIRAIGEKFGYTGNKSQILKTIDTALRTLYND